MYIFKGSMDLLHTKSCLIDRRRLAKFVAAQLFIYKKRFTEEAINSVMVMPNQEKLLRSISFNGDSLIERFGNYRVIETIILKKKDLELEAKVPPCSYQQGR